MSGKDIRRQVAGPLHQMSWKKGHTNKKSQQRQYA